MDLRPRRAEPPRAFAVGCADAVLHLRHVEPVQDGATQDPPVGLGHGIGRKGKSEAQEKNLDCQRKRVLEEAEDLKRYENCRQDPSRVTMRGRYESR